MLPFTASTACSEQLLECGIHSIGIYPRSINLSSLSGFIHPLSHLQHIIYWTRLCTLYYSSIGIQWSFIVCEKSCWLIIDDLTSCLHNSKGRLQWLEYEDVCFICFIIYSKSSWVKAVTNLHYLASHSKSRKIRSTGHVMSSTDCQWSLRREQL